MAFTRLETHADHALFQGQVSGLLATCYENERPLLGLAGLLDWRFMGEISYHLRQGSLSGKEGELTYFPLKKGGKLFHIFLLGCGPNSVPGSRQPPGVRSFSKALEAIRKSRIEPIAISLDDFGNPDQKTWSGFENDLQICLVN